MWLVNVLVLASGILFSLLQTPASNQISSGEKPNQAAERPASSVPPKPADPALAVKDTEPVITIRGCVLKAAEAAAMRVIHAISRSRGKSLSAC